MFLTLIQIVLGSLNGECLNSSDFLKSDGFDF